MIIGGASGRATPREDIFAASSLADEDPEPSLLAGVPASSPAMRWLRQAVQHIADSEEVAESTRKLALEVAAGTAPVSRLITDAAFPADIFYVQDLLDDARDRDLEGHRTERLIDGCEGIRYAGGGFITQHQPESRQDRDDADRLGTCGVDFEIAVDRGRAGGIRNCNGRRPLECWSTPHHCRRRDDGGQDCSFEYRRVRSSSPECVAGVMTRVGNTVAAAVVGIIAAVGLSGCTGSGGSNSVTITWTADGSGESRSFGVSNPLCSETGARTLSFPETPVRSLVVTNGLAGDDVEAWIFENEQAVVFRSENIALAVDERDDGSVEYRGTAVRAASLSRSSPMRRRRPRPMSMPRSRTRSSTTRRSTSRSRARPRRDLSRPPRPAPAHFCGIRAAHHVASTGAGSLLEARRCGWRDLPRPRRSRSGRRRQHRREDRRDGLRRTVTELLRLARHLGVSVCAAHLRSVGVLTVEDRPPLRAMSASAAGPPPGSRRPMSRRSASFLVRSIASASASEANRIPPFAAFIRSTPARARGSSPADDSRARAFRAPTTRGCAPFPPTGAAPPRSRRPSRPAPPPAARRARGR